MNPTRPHLTLHVTARIIAALVLCITAPASTSSSASVAQGFGLAYDTSNEVTLTGTVDRLVSSAVAGAPPGAHLLIRASGETVDTHLGPYLSKDVQSLLEQGESVQVIGVRHHVSGKDIFLVRLLTIAGHQVTIRNERGFLVRERGTRHPRAHQPIADGGVQ
jgi:hypothetical protein